MSRLRVAEIDIRKLGLLVSFDSEKCELFTFFRKADLQRDGKIIWSRLVEALKSNFCTISDKKAVKASDILHVENAKLHRLFMSAISPSIRSVLFKCYGLLPIGMEAYVSEIQNTEQLDKFDSDSQAQNSLVLQVVQMQLLPNGQLLLSLRDHKSAHLSQPPEDELIAAIELGPTDEKSHIVVLAPSGKLGRLVVGSARRRTGAPTRSPGHGASFSHQSLLDFESRKKQIWKTRVEKWLSDRGLDLGTPHDKLWFEVEITTRSFAQSPGAGSPETAQLGASRTIYWPASLCFQLPVVHTTRDASATIPNDLGDPLQFAEEWFLGAEARTKILEDRKASARANPEIDEDSSEPETLHRSSFIDHSPTFYRHRIADAPFGSNIYPTPPDGALSQVTPGMSSMDGIAATPAEPTHHMPESGVQLHDEDMQDMMEPQRGDSGVGSGMYDEDLFGDMPGETFGASSIADEPNWDFFDEPDEPDTDMLDQEAEDMVRDAVEELEQPRSTEDVDDAAHVADGQEDLEQLDMAEEQQSGDHTGFVEDSQIDPRPGVKYGDDEPGADEMTEQDLRSKLPGLLLSKRADSPLSPSDVKNVITEVRGSTTTPSKHEIELTPNGSVQKLRRESDYESMYPTSGKGAHDERYSANGRFWFGGKEAQFQGSVSHKQATNIPKIGVPRSEARLGTQSIAHPADNMLEVACSQTPSSIEDSDFDSSDFLSNDHVSIDAAVGLGRKWTDYAPATPEDEKAMEDPQSETDIQNEFTLLLESFQIDASKILPTDFEVLKPDVKPPSRDHTNDTTIAQILVDQVTQSSLPHGLYTSPKSQSISLVVSEMTKELRDMFGAVENVSLDQLAGMNIPNDDSSQSMIVKLEDSSVTVKREGRPLVASSTIVPYWDALGLQPASGKKNVTALCIHPSGSNVADGCTVFMERLAEAYENCSLGSHNTGQIAGTTNDGLVAWSSTSSGFPDLVQTCERVGAALSRLPTSDDTIMVYMINRTDSRSYLLDTCNAFWSLFSTYRKACGKQTPNELALQIVPLPFVALAETIAVPPQAEYTTLAIEVYNRCPPPNAGDNIAYCGSAVVLAQRSLKAIDFDLNTSAQTPFAKDGKSLHLAYSQSTDKRWITAAWTDDSGHTALTMSYSLRQRESRFSRSVAEVIKKLWEISVELMKKNRTKWRIVVAKEGSAQPGEVNEWITLANQDADRGQVFQHSLILLSTKSEPSLSVRLPPNAGKQAQGSTSQQPLGLYGTPTSTPQASTTSPEQIMATPTPGGTVPNAPGSPEPGFDPNSETDIKISDPTDDTWSVVLSHGVNQSESTLEARPALASGYLLNRSGPSDADGLVAFEVNILHAPVVSPAGRQDLLKEILSQYKGLVSLAKTRGMLNASNSVLPWHLATAVKGQQALSLIM